MYQERPKEALPSYETTFVKLLLYGDDSFYSVTNTLILNASVEYILSSKKFDSPQLQNYFLYTYALFCKATL